MKINSLIIIIFISIISCKDKPNSLAIKTTNKENIIKTFLTDGAWKHHFLTKEWDKCINKGLQKDSSIAYLWQQKALPFWKQKKYSIAILYYNKAVKFDRQKWLSRLGFLECIFAKQYKLALEDLVSYKKEFGKTYEQDHSLEFYMGICHLQLNQYKKALIVFQESINTEEMEHGTSWVHYLDRFYLAITHFELNNYEKAIAEFDLVLESYPNFSDAQFYKSLCLKYIGKYDEAKMLIVKGKLNFEKGYSINEDSSKYEIYPYQITWQWSVINSIL